MPKPSSALVERVDVELGRTKALTRGFVENGTHLRREIGACRVLGLPRRIVGVSGIVDRRNFLDRGVAGGDVAVFSRLCRRCGYSVRDCGGETERGNQPENDRKGIVHVRWVGRTRRLVQRSRAGIGRPHVAGPP
jgi:hypothetical protein